MREDPKSEADRWCRQAQRDFEAAEASRRNGHYEWACFQAQQAAEKALKAYLLGVGAGEAAWGHSIDGLLKVCEEENEGFRKIGRLGRMLDKYYIPTRYPNGLSGGIPADAYQEEDARLALETAQQVIEFVNKKRQ